MIKNKTRKDLKMEAEVENLKINAENLNEKIVKLTDQLVVAVKNFKNINKKEKNNEST